VPVFVLHTRRSVYQGGLPVSKYPPKFSFVLPGLVGGRDQPKRIAYDQDDLQAASFFPVPRYQRLSRSAPALGLLSGIKRPAAMAVALLINLDVGLACSPPRECLRPRLSRYLKARPQTLAGRPLDSTTQAGWMTGAALTYTGPATSRCWPNR